MQQLTQENENSEDTRFVPFDARAGERSSFLSESTLTIEMWKAELERVRQRPANRQRRWFTAHKRTADRQHGVLEGAESFLSLRVPWMRGAAGTRPTAPAPRAKSANNKHK